MSEKIQGQHLSRKAVLYVRQSSAFQVAHNPESQKLQYAMQSRLLELGFNDIEVIDEDLGRSAAGTQARSGFERMVAEVCLGRVGAVAAREVSRFARNSREWLQLVEVCRVVDTVLIDQETVYAPRASNDRLLLGLKGSLNEYELDLLRARSLEAHRAMAKRGELIVIAPVGFRKTEDHRLEKDPDPRVQEAIRLVFDQFERIGSVRQTLLWFHEHGLELPAVTPRGELRWKRPIYGTIYQILTNPAYGGAYAYGKSERAVRFEAGVERRHDRRRPRDQWLALIPGTYEGYVDWERHERIQHAIHGNLQVAARALGAAREGGTLLSGLLRCRRCAAKLTVHYTGNGHDVARYSCHRAWLDKGQPRCISFGGTRVDAAAAEVVLVIHWIGGVHTELRVPRRRRGQNGTHTAPETLDAVRALARICSDAMIANVLNRNGRRTGRGNFWTRERVTALRSHHAIPVCSDERRATEGWLNLTEAARLLGVSARTLRLAVEHGELTAEHPLPDGPWIFRRDVLTTEDAKRIAARASRRSRRPAVPTERQGALDLSMT